jgi:hypothetical protein
MMYCWSTYFNVLGVLFLGAVSLAFLPSKKACWGSGSVRTKNGGKGKTMATHRGKEALLQ